MSEKILCVDDDERLLMAWQRMLRKMFTLSVATSGQEGLDVLASEGPFAVVCADMSMPGMSGIKFLGQVRSLYPDTVRVMITGHQDFEVAMSAVNEGSIFRFLNKPVPQEVLMTTLQSGLDQYHLVTAEKSLLEETLKGSVKVLTEILSLVNPTAFSQATRIRAYVQHIIAMMGLSNGWRFNLAAMLSQVGCVALPPEILNKVNAGDSLTDAEREMYGEHPKVGAELLTNIPRLEPVARMIKGQQSGLIEGRAQKTMGSKLDEIQLGAQILQAVLAFDRLVLAGKSRDEALHDLDAEKEYNPDVLKALRSLESEEDNLQVKQLTVLDLRPGMIAMEDLKALNGLVLLPKGQEVTHTVLARLRNFAVGVGIVEPFRIGIEKPQKPAQAA